MTKTIIENYRPIVTTDYLGGYEYVRINSVTTLKFFPTAEGYVEVSGSSYKYIYQYKDHLGNIRLSYDKTLAIQEENNYYPFGLKHMGYNNNNPSSTNDALKYKYNGKELQDELGLNMTAMDYRQYDNALGRFNSMDRLSELTYDISPYRFGFNNPLVFSDPSGLLEENKESLAVCPTCPNTPAFKPLIDDPNNEYVYDPSTNSATQIVELNEVIVQGKAKAKTASDYFGSLEFNYNGLNDILLGVGATGLKNSYNSNYGRFNSAYYNFYKAVGKSSRLPKPGAQRQLLKKFLSNSKFSASSKLLRRAGIVGTALTVGNISLDVAEDGAIKASSIIDGGSLAALGVATVFCPPCAVAIGTGLLVYGVLDYTFEINDAIDANTEQIQIFDKKK